MSKQVLEDVLKRQEARELWATGCRLALPVTPQDFSMGSVLPAVLYMMRWGHRRGQGQFQKVFGATDASGKPTIASVSKALAEHEDWFEGFGDDVSEAVLSDLLLAHCLENKRRVLGRTEQVQRVFPTHYFSSWIDLPDKIANLRGVPEMIVSMLARQEEGVTLRRSLRGHFSVGAGFDDNLLISIFGEGTRIESGSDGVGKDSLKSDDFDEEANVGLDQALVIRIAQALESAPMKARGENPEIPNISPLATTAAQHFSEDFGVFLRAYGRAAPRQSLLPMLESSLSVGLTTIFSSVVALMLRWSENGCVSPKEEQSPWPLFVDGSSGLDHELRRLSEESVDDLLLRMARLPSAMICLRILDRWARVERLKDLPPEGPDPTERVRFLGDLGYDRHDESRPAWRDLRRTCNELADALADDDSGVPQLLLDEDRHPAWRLADAVTMMMGERQQADKYRKYLTSCLMMDEPNGLARRRKSTVNGKWTERWSIVLTNTMLDYLVHRHLRGANKGTRRRELSLRSFLDILRERYGLYVSQAPPGLSVSADVLHRNTLFLERRLRDLGLFVGVNDAEAMKRLRSRFDGVDSDD